MDDADTSLRTRVDPRRVTAVRRGTSGRGPVLYWMSRDQRAADNWALLYAQDQALARERPLVVVFALAPDFLDATLRHYQFMLDGLRETVSALHAKGIGFRLLEGDPPDTVARYAIDSAAAVLITDFDPLRIKRRWLADVAAAVAVPVFEVDAHNIVPCREASPKQEYAARTIRPKLNRLRDDFLTPFPALKRHPVKPPPASLKPPDFDGAMKRLTVNRSIGPVSSFKPGARAARQTVRDFVADRLADYPEANRDPTVPGQSDLSPYLHFGQVAAQRAALDVLASGAPPAAIEAFLEQLIVRRELADNFCFYNPDYDTVAGFPAWARKTLDRHRGDTRATLYTPDALEQATTHDRLWNAAQREMVVRGKMHNYLRMYWAKKILEWTPSPEEALAITIRLNDRYELDGRDPNGYVGAAWSIGGVHDRPWGERPVFGTIRYMSYNGCRSKFSIDDYIAYTEQLT